MEKILILMIVGGGLYWFFILRPGRLDFWRVAARHPDAAYEYFKADCSWKIFDDNLPEDFRSIVPTSDWVGPFRLIVPALGNKAVYIFGKRSTIEDSENDFLHRVGLRK